MRKKIIFTFCSFLFFVNFSFAQENLQFFSDKKKYDIGEEIKVTISGNFNYGNLFLKTPKNLKNTLNKSSTNISNINGKEIIKRNVEKIFLAEKKGKYFFGPLKIGEKIVKKGFFIEISKDFVKGKNFQKNLGKNDFKIQKGFGDFEKDILEKLGIGNFFKNFGNPKLNSPSFGDEEIIVQKDFSNYIQNPDNSSEIKNKYFEKTFNKTKFIEKINSKSFVKKVLEISLKTFSIFVLFFGFFLFYEKCLKGKIIFPKIQLFKRRESKGENENFDKKIDLIQQNLEKKSFKGGFEEKSKLLENLFEEKAEEKAENIITKENFYQEARKVLVNFLGKKFGENLGQKSFSEIFEENKAFFEKDKILRDLFLEIEEGIYKKNSKKFIFKNTKNILDKNLKNKFEDFEIKL